MRAPTLGVDILGILDALFPFLAPLLCTVVLGDFLRLS